MLCDFLVNLSWILSDKTHEFHLEISRVFHVKQKMHMKYTWRHLSRVDICLCIIQISICIDKVYVFIGDSDRPATMKDLQEMKYLEYTIKVGIKMLSFNQLVLNKTKR